MCGKGNLQKIVPAFLSTTLVKDSSFQAFYILLTNEIQVGSHLDLNVSSDGDDGHTRQEKDKVNEEYNVS